MSTWRYAAVRGVDDATGTARWSIREIYAKPDGSASFAESDEAPCGEAVDELRLDLQSMIADVGDQYLDVTEEPAMLVDWPGASNAS